MESLRKLAGVTGTVNRYPLWYVKSIVDSHNDGYNLTMVV